MKFEEIETRLYSLWKNTNVINRDFTELRSRLFALEDKIAEIHNLIKEHKKELKDEN